MPTNHAPPAETSARRRAVWLTAALSMALGGVPAAAAAAPGGTPASVESVTFRRAMTGATAPAAAGATEGAPLTVAGRVLAEDESGTIFLQQPDGAVWLIAGDEVLGRSATGESFQPLDADALAERVLAELPDGFAVYQTPHYVVAYETSRGFARWTASMLERLNRAFTAHWKRQGFELNSPEFPLVVIVHATAAGYAEASAAELGAPVGGMVGYYSLQSNRVRMYDLTGGEARRAPGSRGSLKEINRMLASPAAAPLVATVVHEATHQIAFNCGLHTRYADLPLWLVEGMAVYFEAPDLSSGRGWRGIGKVNYPRLEVFQSNLPRWKPGGVVRLVATNERLRDPQEAGAAYADAWALNYFLIKQRPADYTAYLKEMAAKPALAGDTAEQRLADFRRYFGDPDELQRVFLAKMARLR
ncbi:MAG: DUF1570 domain-containing protein [Planctomycetota bacterium]